MASGQLVRVLLNAYGGEGKGTLKVELMKKLG